MCRGTRRIWGSYAVVRDMAARSFASDFTPLCGGPYCAAC